VLLFLDPNQLNDYSPAEILEAAAQGHLGLDHRFLHALLDRKEEALPAVIEFAKRDHNHDGIDLAPELIAIFRYWHAPEAISFLIDYIAQDPSEVPDEAVEALVEIGAPALEPLIELYKKLDEEESGEVAFILANLRIRDERILKLLVSRIDYDLNDTVLLLSIYGDPAAIPALDEAAAKLGGSETELRREIAVVREDLASGKASAEKSAPEEHAFDIWAGYPPEADVPVDLLNEDDRTALLDHALESVRSAAAGSFFNRDLTPIQRQKLLQHAQSDESPVVRAKSWEALTSATEQPEVVEAMLKALRSPEMPVAERGGLLVGLAPEADRNEVRAAMSALYKEPAGRAKALEAMWRSVHPTFRDNFARHLNDADLETRRAAVWGVGYYGLRSEVEKLRKLFEDEELRSDALFAYALAVPAEVSRGRMRGLLTRIERDARGLSEMEEDLVKAALDERLMLAGKEPFFTQEED
jgi:HEAT repeat protein